MKKSYGDETCEEVVMRTAPFEAEHMIVPDHAVTRQFLLAPKRSSTYALGCSAVPLAPFLHWHY
ncbi:MAG: hypothetical protein HQL37_15840 [Alphaproteobacteria bacterium]|nr:hypothetical protein [Alphaproteobacteria bacterium]